jgi:hypothetical protein
MFLACLAAQEHVSELSRRYKQIEVVLLIVTRQIDFKKGHTNKADMTSLKTLVTTALS